MVAGAWIAECGADVLRDLFDEAAVREAQRRAFGAAVLLEDFALVARAVRLEREELEVLALAAVLSEARPVVAEVVAPLVFAGEVGFVEDAVPGPEVPVALAFVSAALLPAVYEFVFGDPQPFLAALVEAPAARRLHIWLRAFARVPLAAATHAHAARLERGCECPFAEVGEIEFVRRRGDDLAVVVFTRPEVAAAHCLEDVRECMRASRAVAAD